MAFQAAPLSSAFMGVAILGFLFSAIYLLDRSPSWGFTLCLFFVMMFIASLISMSRVEASDEEALRQLAFHERRHK